MNAMEIRRRLLDSSLSWASEPLYIYQSGDESFKNCTHRSETYEGLLGTTYDACSISFDDSYFKVNPSSHQNATNTIYYFYLDVTRYKKIIVKAFAANTDVSEARVGVFETDGLKSSSFNDENSVEIKQGFSPKEYEFDVEDFKGTRVLAIREKNFSAGMYYEIRME